ncbi:hypothetical protein MKX47_21260 [Solibacillus sp. FSL R7-0668]|uniref:hypothetical protein n=1 Tax=Solibacillus sp. FSL R7-0668 TaxID=2921688 RepID=UPI0030FA4C8E
MKAKTKQKDELLFKPYADNCTTFKNVRVLHFHELAIELVINHQGEKKFFLNSKSFPLYYDTVNFKILNVLQLVRFETEKIKVKYNLGEMIERSDIEQRLKTWLGQSSELTPVS